MKTYSLGYIFLFLILLGCSNYTDETKKLNNILLEYDTCISQSPHLYIIQSKFCCDGCIQAIYFQLENKLIKSDDMPITIISSDKKYISTRLLSKVTFINDTIGLTNREFPTYVNLTIFETNNGKIIKYINMGDSKKIDLPKFVSDFIVKN